MDNKSGNSVNKGRPKSTSRDSFGSRDSRGSIGDKTSPFSSISEDWTKSSQIGAPKQTPTVKLPPVAVNISTPVPIDFSTPIKTPTAPRTPLQPVFTPTALNTVDTSASTPSITKTHLSVDLAQRRTAQRKARYKSHHNIL